MRLRVNGEWMEWPAPLTVADLLERLGLGSVSVGIAVAVNNEVVPRTRWSETVLQDGDAVEIVRAVAGGRGVPEGPYLPQDDVTTSATPPSRHHLIKPSRNSFIRALLRKCLGGRGVRGGRTGGPGWPRWRPPLRKGS